MCRCCWCGAGSSPPSAPSPQLKQLYHHAVSSRIGLGKLSTLPSISDLGREEGGEKVKQVGMAEWSKSLPPVRGVVGSILGHDILWKAIGEQAAPVWLCSIGGTKQASRLGVCKLVGRQPLLETGSPSSSRALLPAAVVTACLIACVAANDVA